MAWIHYQDRTSQRPIGNWIRALLGYLEFVGLKDDRKWYLQTDKRECHLKNIYEEYSTSGGKVKKW